MPSICINVFCHVRDLLSQAVLKPHCKTRAGGWFAKRDILHIDGRVVLLGDLHHNGKP